jgi:HEXXH motif-containing protein
MINSEDLELTPQQLEQLALGYGDEETIGVLRRGQLSRLEQILESIEELAPREYVGPALELLQKARDTNESAFYDALSYPHILEWSQIIFQALLRSEENADYWAHIGHTSVVAAAVAYRCGLDFEIKVPVSNNSVTLPGLGVAIGFKSGNDCYVSCTAGRLTISNGDTTVCPPRDLRSDGFDWNAVRTVVAVSGDQELELQIDDVDPYRAYFQLAKRFPPADRLDDVGFKVWSEVIADAWMSLNAQLPQYVPCIKAAFKVLVPLPTTERPVSDHFQNAFGAVAIANVNHRWLAHSILQETQLAQASALNYLYPLHQSTQDRGSILAPWMLEPVSYANYFENTMTMPAVIEYWSQHAKSSIQLEERINAELLFALWRGRIEHCRERLLASHEITELGRRVITAVPISSLPDLHSVSESVLSAAKLTEYDFNVALRLQNIRADQVLIETLAEAWCQNSQPESGPAITEAFHDSGTTLLGWRARRWLCVRQMADPNWFNDLADDEIYLQVLDDKANKVDTLILTEQFDKARDLCCTRILDRSATKETWAQLALIAYLDGDEGWRALVQYPEVVAALYDNIAALGSPPDPAALVRWLSEVLFS